MIYARAMSKIQDFASKIDPGHAELFHKSPIDHVGLAGLVLVKLWWPQFLSSAAMIAIVNSVVGGVFIAFTTVFALGAESLGAILIGTVAAAAIGAAFLRHKWATWMQVAKGLPMSQRT